MACDCKTKKEAKKLIKVVAKNEKTQVKKNYLLFFLKYIIYFIFFILFLPIMLFIFTKKPITIKALKKRNV